MGPRKSLNNNNGRNSGDSKEQSQAKRKELDLLAVETLRQFIDSSEQKELPENPDASQKKDFEELINKALQEILEKKSQQLSKSDKDKLLQQVMDEIFGFGPINELLEDPDVTEIMVNGFDNIYAEMGGKLVKTDLSFRDNAHVSHTINKIINPLGRRVDESCPAVDARLPDGSRVNAIIPPLSLRGPSVTIRKFSKDPFRVDDLINFGTLTREMADFLSACVRSRINLIVSGGTGSGKTTTLNVLSNFIPGTERIVTVEDTAELQLNQDNLVTLESRPANMEGKGQYTIRELVVNCLRMRPDRIVVGEVRGGEALDMLQAMNTGHDGSISTLHANSPKDAIARLEIMVLMAGMELPLKAIREQVASAVNIIIQQSRLSDGSRKITRISEIIGLVGGAIKMQDIFVFKQAGLDEEGKILGSHLPTGIVPLCMEKLHNSGESFSLEEVPGFAEASAGKEESKKVEEEKKDEQQVTEEILNEEVLNKEEDEESPALDDGVKEEEETCPLYLQITSPEEAEIGAEISFEIFLGNVGEENLYNVRISDEFLDWSSRIEVLAPGESRTFEVDGEAPSGRKELLESTATAKAETGNEETVKTAFTYSIKLHAPQVSIAVGAPEEAAPGEEVALDLTVSNNSPCVDLFDLQLSDSRLQWRESLENLLAGESRSLQKECLVPAGVTELSSSVSLSSTTRFGEPVTARRDWSIPVKAIMMESELVTVAASQGASAAAGTPESSPMEQAVSPESTSSPEPLSTPAQASVPPAAETAKRERPQVPDMPPDRRGFAIPVCTTTGLFRFIQPGDRVDVLVVSPSADGTNNCSTVEDAILLAVDGLGEGEKSVVTVVLAVAPAQLAALACAFQQGTFHLVLRP